MKKRFPERETLNPELPEQVIIPYQVRYRFRPGKNQWPVLQIGSGIATLNYVGNYNWDAFLKDAVYLRANLLRAYGSENLKFNDIFLRYRNIEPVSSSINKQEFLRDKLNIRMDVPSPVVGRLNSSSPSSIQLRTEFTLTNP